MNWFRKLFKKKHKHTPVWESREVIEKTSLDFTTCGVIDIQSATKYLLKGYCFGCGKKIQSIQTIAWMFDEPQPYDIK